MRKMVCLVLCVVMLMSVTTVVCANDMVSFMTSTYNKALNLYGSSSFNGYCGACVGRQLQVLGINSGYLGPNGNNVYNTYSAMSKTSGGWSVNSFPASSYSMSQFLNYVNSCNTSGGYTYIAIGFEKGSSSNDGQTYGHTLLIYSVYNGIVYYTDSWGTAIRTESIADFCHTNRSIDYGNGVVTFQYEGAVWFGMAQYFDFVDVADNTTISGTYKFWWKQSGYGTCDVNMDINGTPLGTLYQDANGYFSYEFDSTKYANGTYIFGAIIRSTSGAEKYVTRTITINNHIPDSQAPTIEDAYITNASSKGYTVHCIVRDNSAALNYVEFPTWTLNGDQDDITWAQYSVSGTSWELNYEVRISDHNNEYGLYVTDIYAYDTDGNSSCFRLSANINNTIPIIDEVTVTDQTQDSYTVNCTLKDDTGLGWVTFPTWTVNNGQDDITWAQIYLSGTSQKISYTVKKSDHNNEQGVYFTDIYVYDTDGQAGLNEHVDCYIESNQPTISNIKVKDISSNGYTIECSVDDKESGIKKVLFPTWSDYNGQDDLVYDWVNNSTIIGSVENGIATFRVNTSEHNGEIGNYTTHIYAYDKCGNVTQQGVWVEVGDPYTEFSVKNEGVNNIFTINCHCMEKGNTVILALYKENRFVKIYNSIYEGETIQFTVTEDYDNYKVMVWDSIQSMIPLCGAEVIEL